MPFIALHVILIRIPPNKQYTNNKSNIFISTSLTQIEKILHFSFGVYPLGTFAYWHVLPSWPTSASTESDRVRRNISPPPHLWLESLNTSLPTWRPLDIFLFTRATKGVDQHRNWLQALLRISETFTASELLAFGTTRRVNYHLFAAKTHWHFVWKKTLWYDVR